EQLAALQQVLADHGVPERAGVVEEPRPPAGEQEQPEGEEDAGFRPPEASQPAGWGDLIRHCNSSSSAVLASLRTLRIIRRDLNVVKRGGPRSGAGTSPGRKFPAAASGGPE